MMNETIKSTQKPPPLIKQNSLLGRQMSVTIFNQGESNTCYAHTFATIGRRLFYIYYFKTFNDFIFPDIDFFDILKSEYSEDISGAYYSIMEEETGIFTDQQKQYLLIYLFFYSWALTWGERDAENNVMHGSDETFRIAILLNLIIKINLPLYSNFKYSQLRFIFSKYKFSYEKTFITKVSNFHSFWNDDTFQPLVSCIYGIKHFFLMNKIIEFEELYQLYLKKHFHDIAEIFETEQFNQVLHLIDKYQIYANINLNKVKIMHDGGWHNFDAHFLTLIRVKNADLFVKDTAPIDVDGEPINSNFSFNKNTIDWFNAKDEESSFYKESGPHFLISCIYPIFEEGTQLGGKNDKTNRKTRKAKIRKTKIRKAKIRKTKIRKTKIRKN
jgi:hypothetical protein